MSQNEAIELLDKYLKGQASEGESKRVEAWLDSVNKENSEWKSLSDADRKTYIRMLYEDLQGKIVRRSGRRKSLKLWQWAAAAIFFLAATYGLLFVTVFNNHQSVQVISVQDYAVLSTGIGELKEVTLADGTQVWLNAKSELKYPTTFYGEKREVYIQGEAFFEVAKNEEQPFIVHSGTLKTKVLGTSFNVSAYPDNTEIEIAVLSGKVAVSRQNIVGSRQEVKDRVELTKNEQVKYANQKDVLVKSEITSVSHYLAWRNGEMVFFHTPMKGVVKILQRNYGLKFQFETEALENVEISGTFDKTQKLEIVLKAICLSMGGKFNKVGNVIRISK